MIHSNYIDEFNELMAEVDRLVDEKFHLGEKGDKIDKVVHRCIVEDLARKLKTRCEKEKNNSRLDKSKKYGMIKI